MIEKLYSDDLANANRTVHPPLWNAFSSAAIMMAKGYGNYGACVRVGRYRAKPMIKIH